MKLQEVFDYFFEHRKLKGNTLFHYKKIEKSFMKWANTTLPGQTLNDFHKQEARKYLASLKSKSINTQHQYITCLKTVFQFVIEEFEHDPDFIKLNPFKKIIKRPKLSEERAKSLEKHLSEDVIKKMMVPFEDTYTEWLRLTALFQLQSGFSWVDLGSNHYEIEEKVIILKRGKNCQPSVIPIQEDLKITLTKLEEIAKKYDSLTIFPFQFFLDKNFNIDRNLYYREYVRYSRFLKENYQITPHMLRHSFAMNKLNEGKWDFDDVATMLGHTSSATTRNAYAYIKKERIIAKL